MTTRITRHMSSRVRSNTSETSVPAKTAKRSRRPVAAEIVTDDNSDVVNEDERVEDNDEFDLSAFKANASQQMLNAFNGPATTQTESLSLQTSVPATSLSSTRSSSSTSTSKAAESFLVNAAANVRSAAVLTRRAPSLPAAATAESLSAALMSQLQSSNDTTTVPPLFTSRRGRGPRPNTSGSGWFDIPSQPMTRELARDLRLIELRNVLDPKRFYKRAEKAKGKPSYVAIGTVISAPHEYYSSRMTREERSQSIAQNVMSNQSNQSYLKRRFDTLQDERRPTQRSEYMRRKHTQIKKKRK